MASNFKFSFRRRGPVAVVAMAAALSLTSAGAASAERQSYAPTSGAARAGVAPGGAYLGWQEHTTAPAAGPQATGPQATGPQLSGPQLTAQGDQQFAARATTSATVTGIDVSGWQRNVNWAYWRAQGKSFAYIKATEGTRFRNSYFASQYTGAYRAGLIRGAYHYALPNRSNATTQANWFVANGGRWSRDGRTLPGVVDMEYNPYGATCYGLSRTAMVAWVRSFTRRYKALTGRDAVIYTNLDWWSRCTGNSTAFSRTNPLWVARYSSSVGRLPGGWPYYTFWQHTTRPLDQNRFSSRRSRLRALANG